MAATVPGSARGMMGFSRKRVRSKRERRVKYQALVLSSLITLVFLYLDLANPPFVRNSLDLLEMKSLDFRFRLRESWRPGDGNSDLLVVGIDEKSVKEIGRWPWSRREMTRLLERLSSGNPRVIAFDILFTEAEVSETLKAIRTVKSDYAERRGADVGFMRSLERMENDADVDRRFAEVVAGAGTIVFPTAMEVPSDAPIQSAAAAEEIPPYLTASSFGLVKRLSSAKVFLPIEAHTVTPPIARLAEQISTLGHVYYQPDRDGVLRWEYLVLKYGDDYYPSFALQIARASLGIPREEMKLWLGEAVELGDIRIPTDERGRMLINYLGPEGTFDSVSAADVLSGGISTDRFKDRIILVGTTAVGTYDLKVTPLSANLSGVEKNATVVDNILRKRFLRRTEGMKLLDGLFIVFSGAVLWMFLYQVSALRGVGVAGGMLIAYLLLAQYLFERNGLWVNVLYPSATLFFTYTSLTVLRFMTEERQGKEIRQIFSSYVSPKMVAELVKDPGKAKLGGDRKPMTVLFSDIRGFTSFSEMHPPEEVVTILNEYMDAMTEVIFRWDGTLDKFVGDAIMVFWGAPLDQPNHAELAVRCALHMQDRLSRLQESWRARGVEPLDAGIGINSGEMVVGNMGAEGRKMDYTVIGDNVNLGARVESLTRQYQAHILITEATYESVRHLVEVKEKKADERRRLAVRIPYRDRRRSHMRIGHALFRSLDEVKVKGKEKPVRLYEIVGLKKEGE